MVVAKQEITGETDWELLILELQTSPNGPPRNSVGQLFDCIYGYISVVGRKWMGKHWCEDRVGDLAVIGFEKILKEIAKFQIPTDDNEGIGRAFKAWIATCCEREWIREAKRNMERSIDPVKLADLIIAVDPSPEEVMLAACESSDGAQRSPNELILARKCLAEQLAKLPPDMRDALLESEDIKGLENPTARGRAGEAKAIAEKYGHTPGAVRTRRSRLIDAVKECFEKEIGK